MKKFAAMVVAQVATILFDKIGGAIAGYFRRRREAKERQARDQANQTTADRSAEAQTPEEAREIGNELP